MSNSISTPENDNAVFSLVGETHKFYAGTYIDLPTAKCMVDLYVNTRKPLIDQSQGIYDTQSIWFDIDSMNGLLADITANGGSGVRFYLGAYPPAGLYPKRTTVVAIGTYKVPDNEVDIDYDDINPAPGHEALTSLRSGLDPYDHGNLCPGGSNCP